MIIQMHVSMHKKVHYLYTDYTTCIYNIMDKILSLCKPCSIIWTCYSLQILTMTMTINSLMLRKVHLIRSVWRPALPWVLRPIPSVWGLGPPGHSAVTLSMSHLHLSTRERLGQRIYLPLSSDKRMAVNMMDSVTYVCTHLHVHAVVFRHILWYWSRYALTWDINCIHFIDPLKCGTWMLTW